MGDDAKQVLVGADPDSASAVGAPSGACFKTWVTPRVIVSTLDDTEPAPGIHSDASTFPAGSGES